VDVGRDAVHDRPVEMVGRLRVRLIASGSKATVKACGVVVAMLPGQQLGAGLVDRYAVNVGTTGDRPGCRAASVVVGRPVADRWSPGGAEVS
jgi:hypothetical protein